ncbi:hypothetical protein [Subtercola sp. YIM 133946]|uniref:hypothetical protein n=1 Tax=Subtercola sp. YIM 133946 TaxID=3118909 RepID=UPI002F943233
MRISLFDVATATALAQILPVLLLALMVELRRTELHRRSGRFHITRGVMAAFFGAFAVIETVLVLSIDGRVFPFRWSDLVAALIIFALLWLLFLMSMVSSRREQEKSDSDTGDRSLDAHEDDDEL